MNTITVIINILWAMQNLNKIEIEIIRMKLQEVRLLYLKKRRCLFLDALKVFVYKKKCFNTRYPRYIQYRHDISKDTGG